ncbi:MAG: DUF5018 domain-containing protein [Bacteroidales bacterium]|nr:DUF5018 domain-containing protein [Bacteroidales bacterium]
MKKISLAILTVLVAVTSCHKPEYVLPTADRQGLTSLTAIFTFGPYVDQEMAKLTIEDDTAERFVIPVPFYYPVTSDYQTLAYMTKVRVQAELQPNFKLEPALTLLDLTEENWFTYTDPFGKSRKICITGERVKSSECDILSFTLSNPTVSGVVDKDKKTVILPTKDDVSSAKATVSVSAHATITPDPSKPRDYSKPVKFTVIAHDGTECEYTVQTGDPEKIDQGFVLNSLEKLFNFDPVSRLALPDYKSIAAVSLASLEGYLVICTGDGDAPVYVDGLTGVKIGNIKLGSAVAGAITNDEMEHMLITNVALGGENREYVNIYKTSSVKSEPELFHSFENPLALPIGHKMKVFGNIEKDAVISLTAEGVDGVTVSTQVIYLTVKDGEVVSTDMLDLTGYTPGWGSAPVNMATVVPASLDPAHDGWFYDYYGENTDGEMYLLHYYNNGTDNVIGRIGDWSLNPNCLDSKTFNNARYMTLFVVSHFPNWGIGPRLYLFNITDPSSAAVEISNEEIAWYQKGDYAGGSGDVVLAPSADGYKLYVYYYDNNAQVVGGYVVDCIKRQ